MTLKAVPEAVGEAMRNLIRVCAAEKVPFSRCFEPPDVARIKRLEAELAAERDLVHGQADRLDKQTVTMSRQRQIIRDLERRLGVDQEL